MRIPKLNLKQFAQVLKHVNINLKSKSRTFHSLICWINRDYMLRSADAAQLLQSDDSTAGGIAYADTTLMPFSVATHGSAK